MPDNTEPSALESDKNPGTPNGSSLLSEIIEANKEKVSQTEAPSSVPALLEVQPSQKKREPLTLGMFMKLIGSLFLVAVIFFGSFLAYIVLNPSEALFFANTFSISPKDIARLLYMLIRWSFGAMLFVASIVWIISLFRAIWTPKDLKRKKLLNWLTAGAIGILVFVIVGLWAFLYRTVGATEWDNLNGSILLYDSDLYKDNKDLSELTNTTNLIGPINILFDIRSNALLVEKRGLYKIDSFEIDFDGARCTNGRTIISGSNPKQEQSLICAFDSVKAYKVRGSYTVTNRLGEKENIDIVIPAIEIRGLVDIRKSENIRGKKIITLDAKDLKNLGNPRWLYKTSEKEVEASSITEELKSPGEIVGLKLWGTSIDRIFILEDKDTKSVDGSLVATADTLEDKLYHLSLSGVSLNPNEISDTEWLLDNQNIICTRGSEKCDYKFTTYGKHKVSVSISLASGQKYTFETDVDVTEPLKIVRHVKVTNSAGLLLNGENTFDRESRAYKIENAIIPPETLTFDARDIVSANPGYSIESVLWKINNGKKTEEKKGNKVEITFGEPLRYTVECIYTFKKEVATGEVTREISQDTVIVDIERRNLMPRLDYNLSSDYVPSTVTVDASQSQSENGEIKKFLFDFGEGKPVAEGDAIKQYTYTTPGEKTITLTIIDQGGTSESLKKTIVLKDQTKQIQFTPSINPGIMGNPVDFEAVGTNGQVQDYVWNFGDNTPVSRGYTVSHTFSRAGTYTVSLTIIYADGTEQSEKKTFEVIESL